MVPLYLVSGDKLRYQHCFPSSLWVEVCVCVCVKVWGGVWALKPPLYLLSPQREYVRNAGNLTDPWVVPVWLPALLPAHVLGIVELPDTGHRPTTPLWETRRNWKDIWETVWSLAGEEPVITGTQWCKYHTARPGIHQSSSAELGTWWNLLPACLCYEAALKNPNARLPQPVDVFRPARNPD